jgi:hypothetical protein
MNRPTKKPAKHRAPAATHNLLLTRGELKSIGRPVPPRGEKPFAVVHGQPHFHARATNDERTRIAEKSGRRLGVRVARKIDGRETVFRAFPSTKTKRGPPTSDPLPPSDKRRRMRNNDALDALRARGNRLFETQADRDREEVEREREARVYREELEEETAQRARQAVERARVRRVNNSLVDTYNTLIDLKDDARGMRGLERTETKARIVDTIRRLGNNDAWKEMISNVNYSHMWNFDDGAGFDDVLPLDWWDNLHEQREEKERLLA